MAYDADHVRIYSRSHRWAIQPNGGFRSVGEAFPVNPDCIELTFFKWDEEYYDYEAIYKLVAVNSDNTRYF